MKSAAPWSAQRGNGQPATHTRGSGTEAKLNNYVFVRRGFLQSRKGKPSSSTALERGPLECAGLRVLRSSTSRQRFNNTCSGCQLKIC